MNSSQEYALIECDKDGKIVCADTGSLGMFGYARDDLEKGLNIFRLVVPEQHYRIKERLAGMTEAKKEEWNKGYYKGVRQDGTTFPMLFIAVPSGFQKFTVIIFDGGFGIGLSDNRDVWKKSAEKYSVLFQSSPAIIAISTAKDGRFIEANAVFQEVTGYDNSAIIGHGSEEIGLWIDPRERVSIIKALFDGIPVRNWKCRFQKKTGESITGLVSADLIDISGEQCIQWVILDITEQEKKENELRESEQRLRSFVESTNDWLWIIDTNGVYTWCSSRVKDILGYDQEEIIGKTPFDFMPQDEAKQIESLFESIQELRKPFSELENINIHKNGQHITIETSGVPLFDREGNFSGYMGADRDITRRKDAEDALKKREEELTGKTLRLEEAGIALKILFEQRDEERKALEDSLLTNIYELVSPYIEKLKKTSLTQSQATYLDILDLNLKNIISPFQKRIASYYAHLTPTEIQVADLIRQGRKSKEIAMLMNVSKRTIDSHRESIRNKLNIMKSKTDLQTYLKSLK